MLRPFALALIIAFPAQAETPSSYMQFCARHISECAPGAGVEVSWNAVKDRVTRINASVNRSMTWRPDVGDVWKIGGKSGDCEDFALTKRSRLIAAGIPAGALRMAIVQMQDGQYHAVLSIETDRGALTLDNRTDRVLARSETGYRWIKQATAQPMKWEMVE